MTDPIDELANDIRHIDGRHTLGAAFLAEKLVKLGYVKVPQDETLRDRCIEFLKRVNPILHEPLRTKVAEEWADQLMQVIVQAPSPSVASSTGVRAKSSVSSRSTSMRRRPTRTEGPSSNGAYGQTG